MHMQLAEDTKFVLEFDDEMPDAVTLADSLSWGSDPMEALQRKQELERDELMAYLQEHMH